MKALGIMGLGLLGGLLFIIFGAFWISNWHEHKDYVKQFLEMKEKNPADYELLMKSLDKEARFPIEVAPKRANAGYAMIPLGLLAIVAVVRYSRLGSKKAAAILAACGIIPLLFSFLSLLFGVLLIAAAVLAIQENTPPKTA